MVQHPSIMGHADQVHTKSLWHTLNMKVNQCIKMRENPILMITSLTWVQLVSLIKEYYDNPFY